MLDAPMAEPSTEVLKGGHHNSLGRTEEVVQVVLADRARLNELFAGLGDRDELVRMRVGDALEKVCAQRPEWLVPRVERLLGEVGEIEQPSVQWHLAQMLQRLRPELSDDQATRATKLLKRNLTGSSDWIVLNRTMDALAEWAARDRALAAWLRPELKRLSRDQRKSVASRASRHLANLPG
jgi:hypothetical protein